MPTIVKDSTPNANPPRDEKHHLFGHSADVDLLLHVGDEKLSLTHVGGENLRLKHARPGLAGKATLEIVVDGVSTLDALEIVGQTDDGHALLVRYEVNHFHDLSLSDYLKASPPPKRR